MGKNKVMIDKTALEELNKTTQDLTEKNQLLSEEIVQLKKELERMNELLLLAQKARFGQSSEKRTYVLQDETQLKLELFNEAEAEQNPEEPEPDEESIIVKPHKRKKKRTIEDLTAGLPVEKRVFGLTEEELRCEACGGRYEKIGEHFVCRRLVVKPREVYLEEYYSESYACKGCEKESGYANIIEAKTPPMLMKHSLASASMVATIMVQKYVDGLPLARQEKIWAREGIGLVRATMSNWVIKCAQDWLKPLYERMKKELLSSRVIYADETVVQVLKEEGKAATSKSRMWVYSSSESGIRYFEYQPDRSGKHAAAFLEGYRGCLVTDGYSGYNRVEGVIRCGCWVHMRRKWHEAMPKGARKATCKAAIGYDYCNKLFALEGKLTELSKEDRKSARQAKAKPLLEAYWSWVETLEAEPGSKLAAAVKYAKNQKEYLNAFLEHGEVEISNNFAENAIRPFAIGRKNWLFSDTVRGADSSAIVYSIVETAKANGLDPYRYLEYVFINLPYLGTNPSYDSLEGFMPWSPKVRERCSQPQKTTKQQITEET